jgi:hypothetical protein
MAWIGRKKIAFVPVYRPNAHPPDQIPDNWSDQIMGRVVYDPDPFTAIDRSLRAYIHTVSSGIADLDPLITPMQTVDEQNVPPNALEGTMGAQLRAAGCSAAAIVMLGGVGAGTAEFLGGFWARFVMAEGVGVWAMEFMHCLTGFGDLYTLPGYSDNAKGDLGDFDNMVCVCGTHPTAYTKAAIGWIDPSTIAIYTAGRQSYDLHSVGLVQPPPSGRWAAVRLGAQVPYTMVESRQRVDQFDRGIPAEGVLVYRVQTSSPQGLSQNNLVPAYRLASLQVGQSFTSDDGFNVQVNAAISGGFTVTIYNPLDTTVPDVMFAPALVAAMRVHNAGLVAQFTGMNQTGAWVSSQSPLGGTPVPRGSIVNMVLHAGPPP